MNSKNFKIALLTLLIIVVSFLISSCKEKDTTTKIFEIKNTEQNYIVQNENFGRVEKHYMMLNPPEDLHQLKKIVEEFYNQNPIDIDALPEKNIERHFSIWFYRESKELPRNWQPTLGWDEDPIDHHVYDIIAAVYWKTSNSEKRYSVMKKSKNKNTYGNVIESIHYVGDEIVQEEKEQK